MDKQNSTVAGPENIERDKEHVTGAKVLQIFTANFYMYTVCGIWRPNTWNLKSQKFLYSLYTCLYISMLYTFILSQFLDMMLLVANLEEFTTNALVFISSISVGCKATTVVIRYDNIVNLTKVLLKYPCKPGNEEEVTIQRKCENFVRLYTIRYAILVGASVTGGTIRSLFFVMDGNIPYRAWLPYDCSRTIPFLFTVAYQTITVTLSAIVNVATETLIFGFILQTCAQLEILESRFKKLIDLTKATKHTDDLPEKIQNVVEQTFSRCITHHLCIYKYAKEVNRIFNFILFVQFFTSILVLCATVYHISTMTTTSPDFLGLIFYTICMFVQIFIYCWSGNEVMLKSVTFGAALYGIDWTSLSKKEKQSLVMIMRRSTVPIVFVSSFLVTLTLESYVNILKASYSAFNLLQQS